MAQWTDRPATTALCIFLLFATTLFRLSAALQSVSGSPCASLCSDENAGTLQNDTVCLDEDYKSQAAGRNFQSCIGCLLNSTAVHTAKNETDVGWGLFSLRYALSSCMFAVPEERISISSPCQVTCAPLNVTIGSGLTLSTTNANANYDFCNIGVFDDTDINNCAFCYSFIPQQLFLANFLQSLHIACRQTPVAGQPFFPDAARIFNETLIAGPSTSNKSNSGSGGIHGWKLALAIALPIVGGVLLIGGGCWGCFLWTRKRRQRMAQSGRMSRIHSAHATDSVYSPVSGKFDWNAAEPPREMQAISPPVRKHPSPGLAQGRWSQHLTPAVAAGGGISGQGTPLRNSFQHEDIGPGAGQLRDPNLHEQYFGVTDGVEDIAGPSNTGLGLYEGADHAHLREEERGHWVQ